MIVMQPKIILVEDNPVFQTLIIKQFDELFPEVIVFDNGLDAMNEIMNNPPDLIILDYELIGEMSGLDILKELKKISASIPIIFFTANIDISITSSILKVGVVEYIEKNIFSLPRLKKSVINALKNSMGQAAV
ncbi:MAG: response regulator [Sphingobacteriales bacterium]|nr:MAG: response regulator [Sphingobacteriales bacterium]